MVSNIDEEKLNEQIDETVTSVFSEMERLIEQKSDLCVKCQACCKCIGIYTAYPYDVATAEFYTIRGFKVIDKNGYVFLHMDLPCPKLTENGCSIYENRPAVCAEFDGRIHYDGPCAWNDLENTGEDKDV